MSQPINGSTKERVSLSRDRVLAGAIRVADAGGIGALTIRTLAQELGAKPMSVYHYVANKDEIIDGIVDLVYAEIDLPVPFDPEGSYELRYAGRRRAGEKP
jgi:AcrR family transcriptional regulator